MQSEKFQVIILSQIGNVKVMKRVDKVNSYCLVKQPTDFHMTNGNFCRKLVIWSL